MPVILVVLLELSKSSIPREIAVRNNDVLTSKSIVTSLCGEREALGILLITAATWFACWMNLVSSRLSQGILKIKYCFVPWMMLRYFLYAIPFLGVRVKLFLVINAFCSSENFIGAGRLVLHPLLVLVFFFLERLFHGMASCGCPHARRLRHWGGRWCTQQY